MIRLFRSIEGDKEDDVVKVASLIIEDEKKKGHEKLAEKLKKEGKTSGQAIGYLDDGTMIVCENGREKIGETTTIKVTSVLQTAAGRMIFGRLEGAGI